MKKIIILIVLISNFVNYSFSQTINKQQQNALNVYIEYMDFTVKEINDAITCISEYYQKIENHKKFESYKTGFYARPVCFGEKDETIYKLVFTKNKYLNSSNIIKLNSLLTRQHETYQKINRNLQELEIYHRLNDYQSDNFKRSDELFAILQQLISQFNTTHQQLYSELFLVYRKMQSFNRNNKYHIAEEFMLSFLNKELKLYETWHTNFATRNFTNSFPHDQIIKNINQTDLEYWNFDKINNFKHPVSFYFKGFFDKVLFDLQRIKRNSIDGYDAKGCVSDIFSNNSYNYYKVQTNSIIWEFNSFTYACKSKNIFLLDYPRQPYEFVINKNSTVYSENDIVFASQNNIPYLFKTSIDKCNVFRITKYKNTNSPFQIKTPKIQTKPISEKTAKSLNNYLDLINKIIDITSDRAKNFRSLNKTINLKVNENYSEFNERRFKYWKMTSDYKLVRSLYEKTINDSIFIPTEYRKSLTAQTKAIFQISEERRQLPAKINNNISSKAFLNDSFTTIYSHIQRFDTLWNEFDLRIQVLFNDILTIYNSYPKVEANNSWIISANALNSVRKESKILIFDVKKYLLFNEQIVITDNNLRSVIRQTLLDEYKNMDGIQKLGRYHGHCPYSYYEDIAEDAGYIANEFLKFKDKSLDTLKVAEYSSHLFLRRYKDIIRDYNKFVWLANGNYDEGRHINPKVFLLKNIFQPDIFKFLAPEIIDPRDSVFTSLTGSPTNNLILLLDVSNSMNKDYKLPLLKTSFIKLLKIMRPQDKVAIVTFSGKSLIVLNSTSCANKQTIRKIISDLETGGSTNILSGIETAYKIANENLVTDGNNRIILATDGEFPIDNKMKSIISQNASKQVFLTIFHFTKSVNENQQLKKLAKKGKGNYEIITPDNMNLNLVNEVK